MTDHAPQDPRRALRDLIAHHLNVPAQQVPAALLDDAVQQMPLWAETLATSPLWSSRRLPQDWSQHKLSRQVIHGWVATRDLDLLDDWLNRSPPNDRLAALAFREALAEGWEEGAKRVWASDHLHHGPALIEAWSCPQRHANDQRWTIPWLESLTWPASTPVPWSSALNRARTAALAHAWSEKNAFLWQRYVQQGVTANNQDGLTLLESVGRAPVDHPWAGQAFKDLLAAKALWSMPMVLHAVRNHRVEQMDALLTQRRCGLNERQRVLLLCQVALAEASGGLIDPTDAHRVFEAFRRWGLPTEARFQDHEIYTPLYRSAFPGGREHLGIALDQRLTRWTADHAPRLSTTRNVVYLADHWGYATAKVSAAEWSNPDVAASRRLTFAQALEARGLREAMATVITEDDPGRTVRARL